MMRRPLLLALWPLAAAVAVVSVSRADHGAAPRPWHAPALPPSDSARSADRVATSDVQSVLARNVFRATRRPSAIGDPPTPDSGGEAALDPSELRIVALVGPPWVALVTGLDESGSVVRMAVGDTHAGYRVVSIRDRLVHLDGPAGRITLEHRPPW